MENVNLTTIVPSQKNCTATGITTYSFSIPQTSRFFRGLFYRSSAAIKLDITVKPLILQSCIQGQKLFCLFHAFEFVSVWTKKNQDRNVLTMKLSYRSSQKNYQITLFLND